MSLLRSTFWRDRLSEWCAVCHTVRMRNLRGATYSFFGNTLQCRSFDCALILLGLSRECFRAGGQQSVCQSRVVLSAPFFHQAQHCRNFDWKHSRHPVRLEVQGQSKPLSSKIYRVMSMTPVVCVDLPPGIFEFVWRSLCASGLQS